MTRVVRAAVGLIFVATLVGCGATGATTGPTSAVPSQAPVVTPLGSGAGSVASTSSETAGRQSGSSGLTLSGIAGTGPQDADWISPPFDLAADIYFGSWIVNQDCPLFQASLVGPAVAVTPGFAGGQGRGGNSGGAFLGAVPAGTYQLRVRDPNGGVCSFAITLLGETANGTGNLGPWNVTIVADSQETQPNQFEASIPAGFTRHVLTLAIENVSGVLIPDFIGGVVRSSDGFVYPQSGPSVVEFPIEAGTVFIPPGFRVPARLSVDVASNAQDPTVSLCLLVAFYPFACGASRVEASLASVPSSGSVSFAAPGALPVGSTLAQGPLSFTVTGFGIDCATTNESVTVRVKSTYGYPLQPGMNLEVFDPAGRLASGFLDGLVSVPPGGSLDIAFGTRIGGPGCGGPAGTYVGVLQLAPLVADAQSTQALAGAETFVFAMPSPVHQAP